MTSLNRSCGNDFWSSQIEKVDEEFDKEGQCH